MRQESEVSIKVRCVGLRHQLVELEHNIYSLVSVHSQSPGIWLFLKPRCHDIMVMINSTNVDASCCFNDQISVTSEMWCKFQKYTPASTAAFRCSLNSWLYLSIKWSTAVCLLCAAPTCSICWLYTEVSPRQKLESAVCLQLSGCTACVFLLIQWRRKKGKYLQIVLDWNLVFFSAAGALRKGYMFYVIDLCDFQEEVTRLVQRKSRMPGHLYKDPGADALQAWDI